MIYIHKLKQLSLIIQGVARGAEYNRYDMVDIFFKQLKLRGFDFTNNWVGSKI